MKAWAYWEGEGEWFDELGHDQVEVRSRVETVEVVPWLPWPTRFAKTLKLDRHIPWRGGSPRIVYCRPADLPCALVALDRDKVARCDTMPAPKVEES